MTGAASTTTSSRFFLADFFGGDSTFLGGILSQEGVVQRWVQWLADEQNSTKKLGTEASKEANNRRAGHAQPSAHLNTQIEKTGSVITFDAKFCARI